MVKISYVVLKEVLQRIHELNGGVYRSPELLLGFLLEGYEKEHGIEREKREEPIQERREMRQYLESLDCDALRFDIENKINFLEGRKCLQYTEERPVRYWEICIVSELWGKKARSTGIDLLLSNKLHQLVNYW